LHCKPHPPPKSRADGLGDIVTHRCVTTRHPTRLKVHTMLTINKLMPQGRGLSKVLIQRGTSVELDWDTRQKSRFDTTDSSGRSLGFFLHRGTVVRGGDVAVAEDGSLVRVIAAAQPVLRVQHCPQHGAPSDLLKAAYHLGNRHVAVELKPDLLQLEPDHVLADMLRSMHLIVNETTAPFEPEGGAYASHDAHGHAQEHGQDRAHGHAHDHDPVAARKVSIPIACAAPAAPQPHVHGPGCGHDHGHGDHGDHGDHGHKHGH
jgi:urease accessory protein